MYMSSNESHFSENALRRSEGFQNRFAGSALGRRLIWVATGSTSPGYRQLDWNSEGVTARTPGLIGAPGDPKARGPARFWRNATVLAASIEDLEAVQAQLEGRPVRQAVTYMTGGTPHVGSLPDGEPFFHEVHRGDEDILLAVGARLGKNLFSGTLGYWDQETQTFQGAAAPIQLEAAIPVGNLATKYEGISFI